MDCGLLIVTMFDEHSGDRIKSELLELFDSVEAKQYKRPDMNEDLRLGFALNDFAGTKWKNLTGTGRWSDGHPRLLSPHTSVL